MFPLGSQITVSLKSSSGKSTAEPGFFPKHIKDPNSLVGILTMKDENMILKRQESLSIYPGLISLVRKELKQKKNFF